MFTSCASHAAVSPAFSLLTPISYYMRICTVVAGPMRPQPMDVGRHLLLTESNVGFQLVRLLSLRSTRKLCCAVLILLS